MVTLTERLARVAALREAWLANSGDRDGLRWAVGDELIDGEREYGDDFAQALDPADDAGYWSQKTLRNLRYVAGKVDASRRRDNLTWGHHACVAGLSPDLQDELLQAAEAGALSVQDLRRLVRDVRKAERQDETAASDQGDPTGALALNAVILSALERATDALDLDLAHETLEHYAGDVLAAVDAWLASEAGTEYLDDCNARRIERAGRRMKRAA